MPFETVSDRPTAYFALLKPIFTGEHFPTRRQPDEAGRWRVSGDTSRLWSICRRLPLGAASRWGLPFDADRSR